MKIAIANDHRGLFAKETIKTIVSQIGHEWIDFGCYDEQPVDYPDLVYAAAIEVVNNKADRAIFICSTGMGMCIAANKVKGIRAVTCFDELNARISRSHNNANVLCLAGDLIGLGELNKMVAVWLNTEFIGSGRHERRLKKITAIEEGKDPREMKLKSFVLVQKSYSKMMLY